MPYEAVNHVFPLSKIKKQQIRSWFSRNIHERIVFLILYGPTGSGKKTALRILLTEWGVPFVEFHCGDRQSDFEFLFHSIVTSNQDNFLVEAQDAVFERVIELYRSLLAFWKKQKVQKRVFIVLSEDSVDVKFHFQEESCLDCIHIPRCTDTTIKKILLQVIDKFKGSYTPSDINTIIPPVVKKSNGDIRSALKEIHWLLIEANSPIWMEIKSDMGRDVKFHLRHIMMKLFSGKLEYQRITGCTFLWQVGHYALLENLREHIIHHYVIETMAGAASLFSALSFAEIYQRSTHTFRSPLGILYFLSAYSRSRYQDKSQSIDRIRSSKCSLGKKVISNRERGVPENTNLIKPYPRRRSNSLSYNSFTTEKVLNAALVGVTNRLFSHECNAGGVGYSISLNPPHNSQYIDIDSFQKLLLEDDDIE